MFWHPSLPNSWYNQLRRSLFIQTAVSLSKNTALAPFPDGCGRSKPLIWMHWMQLSTALSWSFFSEVALCHRARGAQLPVLFSNSNCGASRQLLLPCWLLQLWWVLRKLPFLWFAWFARGGDEAALPKQTWRGLQAKLEDLLQSTLQVEAHLLWKCS